MLVMASSLVTKCLKARHSVPGIVPQQHKAKPGCYNRQHRAAQGVERNKAGWVLVDNHLQPGRIGGQSCRAAVFAA